MATILRFREIVAYINEVRATFLFKMFNGVPLLQSMWFATKPARQVVRGGMLCFNELHALYC
jgi:hypothetical protein